MNIISVDFPGKLTFLVLNEPNDKVIFNLIFAPFVSISKETGPSRKKVQVQVLYIFFFVWMPLTFNSFHSIPFASWNGEEFYLRRREERKEQKIAQKKTLHNKRTTTRLRMGVRVWVCTQMRCCYLFMVRVWNFNCDKNHVR